MVDCKTAQGKFCECKLGYAHISKTFVNLIPRVLQHRLFLFSENLKAKLGQPFRQGIVFVMMQKNCFCDTRWNISFWLLWHFCTSFDCMITTTCRVPSPVILHDNHCMHAGPAQAASVSWNTFTKAICTHAYKLTSKWPIFTLFRTKGSLLQFYSIVMPINSGPPSMQTCWTGNLCGTCHSRWTFAFCPAWNIHHERECMSKTHSSSLIQTQLLHRQN